MLTVRLNRLIGQLNGVKRMVDEDAACEDVMIQLGAVNGALHKLAFLFLDVHVRRCVRDGVEKGNADVTIEALAQAIEGFSKLA